MTSPVAKMATEANASCGVNWMVRPWALAARSSTAADDVHGAIAFMRIYLSYSERYFITSTSLPRV